MSRFSACIYKIYDGQGWLLCLTSHRQRGHLETAPPFTMSLAKDVKLDKYTVPTGNRTLGRHMAVHYITAEPCKLHYDGQAILQDMCFYIN